MNKTFDVIIVGNGALGMTLARSLARTTRDTRIALVGPAQRPGSASLTAGAMINVWAELESDTFDNVAASARFELPRRARELWPAHAAALAEESGLPIDIAWGTYVINSGKGTAVEDAAFTTMLDQLGLQNIAHEVVKPGDATFLDPDPAARPLRIVKIPDGRVDSRQVITALDTILNRHRTLTRFDHAAVALSIDAAGIKQIELSTGDKITAPQVVLANGTFAQDLIDQVPSLQRSVPRLLYGAGSALDIEFPAWCQRYAWSIPAPLRDLDCVVRTMDRGGACGLHLIPLGDARYYFGSSSGVWTEPELYPRIHAIGWLINGLKSEFHHSFFHATVKLRGPGFRPVSMDTFPLLGESELKGIWFLNGMKRDGFTCAPYLANELTKAMASEAHTLPMMFQPSRKLISYRTRPQAIEAAIQAAIGGEIMHGQNLAPYRTTEWQNMHRSKIDKIYERRELGDFGIHPELIHIYDTYEFFKLCNHERSI